MPAAIFFDLDGTLVDTAGDLGCAANAVRAAQGLGPLPLADYRPVASAGARGLLGMALGIGPEHADFAQHRAHFLAHYEAHIADHSQLFAGMDASLKALEAQNIAWGVVTNKPKRYTDKLLEQLGLAQRCAAIVSADEVAAAKPAPDALYLACERARVSASDCYYVGDDLRDIVAGRAAGMRTVAAAWGYEGEHAIDTWQADIRLETPHQLTTLIADAAL
jgi:phosphoglycolate phosphatase